MAWAGGELSIYVYTKIYLDLWPVVQVSAASEGRDLHSGFQDEDRREEVVENFQGRRQNLEMKRCQTIKQCPKSRSILSH